MVKTLISLILSFIQEDKLKDLYNGLYIKEYTPKVIGTKIRRLRE